MRRACLPAGRKRTHEARRALGEGVLPSPKRSGARAPRPQARKCEEKRRTDHARREQPQRKCPRRMPRVALSFGALDPHKRMPGLSYLPRANRLIYPLYEPITKSLEPFAAKGRRPRATLPDPSATPRKKERKACLPQAWRRRQESAGRLDARRPRRAGAESSRRSSAPLARGNGFNQQFLLK